MGCGASARRAQEAQEASACDPGLRELLRGLGVQTLLPALRGLTRTGVRARSDLAGLRGDAAWVEADAALRGAGVADSDRERIGIARHLDLHVPQGRGRVPVALLRVGQALQAPKRLERAFLGVGWTSTGNAGASASCVSFRSGTELDDISCGRPSNRNSSIVHAGDAVQEQVGQSALAGLRDRERVYLWLSRLPAEADCLVLLLSGDLGGLESAYARLVNADTNQELCRFCLGKKGLQGEHLAFAKLYRCHGKGRTGPWQLLALCMPVAAPDDSSGGVVSELQRSGCCFPPPAAFEEGTQSVSGLPPQWQHHTQRPLAVVPCAGLAAATEAGIGAAAAILAREGAASAEMFAPATFEQGVDFANLGPGAETVVGADDLLPPAAAGDVYGWAVAAEAGVNHEAVAQAVREAAANSEAASSAATEAPAAEVKEAGNAILAALAVDGAADVEEMARPAKQVSAERLFEAVQHG